MTDIIIGAVVLVILAAAIRYLVKAKKSGVKCIGCDSGCACSQKSGEDINESVMDCGCGCGSACENGPIRSTK